MAEKVKLHRCSVPTPGFAVKWHACAKVQQALDERGIDYEIAREGVIRLRRKWVKQHTGQGLLPVIEFGDGSTYRAESDEMVARISAGKLFDGS